MGKIKSKISMRFKRAVFAVLSSAMIMFSAMPGINGTVADMSITAKAATANTVENLNRGLVAFNTGSGMMVSWRYLADDQTGCTYKLYRDNSLIYTSTGNEATSYLDKQGNSSSVYRVDSYQGNTRVTSDTTILSSNAQYKDVKLSRPGSNYTPNDCSLGDVDGDGTYEIFLKWDPSDSKDNSQSGKTSNVYIDCYKLDGTRLWRIDLGVNIRAGAHYTQFLVADFDGDGKAEMTCKTADGTKDGQGKVIGDGSKSYRNSKGYILSGPEYYSLFEGSTGRVLDTVNYEPARGNVSSWGDSYGNRCDRFLGAVMYLDSNHPSAVTVRGYYTRMTACAYDVKDKKLVKRWYFDSNDSGNSAAKGNGNHNCMPADVDGDGKQELIMGSCCIDDNGKLLWSAKLGHGDALHVGDLLPNRSGIEVYMCHEVKPYGVTLMDGKTGAKIWHINGSSDTGRCSADNVTSESSGAEFWGNGWDVLNTNGKTIASNRPAINFLCYWDGDLEREILDGNKIMDYTLKGGSKTLLQDDSCTSCNTTKATPCISADLFGDWREEVIWATTDGNALRIYETNYTTDKRITTLMQDPQYRNQVAGQNIAYNQPPHPSFYIGSDASLPARPNVNVLGSKRSGNTTATEETTIPKIVASALTDNGYYMIKNTNSGLYLEVSGENAQNGTIVQQWGANGPAAHNVWRVKYAGNGYYKVYSQLGDGATYLLDVTGGKAANGTAIEIYQESSTNAQLFKFSKTGRNGSYIIATKASSDASCIGITGGSMDPGTAAIEWQLDGTTNQEWVLEAVDYTPAVTLNAETLTDGAYYQFKNVNSGLFMDVAGGAAENGTNVQQWGAQSAEAYNTFKAVSAGNGYYKLVSQVGDGNTYLLDVAGSSAANKTNVQIWSDTGADAQLFKFVKNTDGSYRIYTKCSEDKSVVEIINAETGSGANVQQFEANGASCQNWYVTQVEYKISTENNSGNTTEEPVNTTEEPVNTAEGEAEFTIIADWGSGATFTLKVTNNTGVSYDNGWTVTFKSDRPVTQVWSGNLTDYGDGTYSVSNPEWNASFPAGGQIEISGAMGEGNGATVSNVTIQG